MERINLHIIVAEPTYSYRTPERAWYGYSEEGAPEDRLVSIVKSVLQEGRLSDFVGDLITLSDPTGQNVVGLMKLCRR